jgi:hypothetical protein
MSVAANRPSKAGGEQSRVAIVERAADEVADRHADAVGEQQKRQSGRRVTAQIREQGRQVAEHREHTDVADRGDGQGRQHRRLSQHAQLRDRGGPDLVTA